LGGAGLVKIWGISAQHSVTLKGKKYPLLQGVQGSSQFFLKFTYGMMALKAAIEPPRLQNLADFGLMPSCTRCTRTCCHTVMTRSTTGDVVLKASSHLEAKFYGLSHGTCGHDLEGLGLDSGLEELH